MADRWQYDTYLLTYLLTPWCRVLLEKLTGLQLVKKFPAFHGTRRFITALTSVRHLSLSWANPIQSIYPHPTSCRSILILSTHLRLGLPSGVRYYIEKWSRCVQYLSCSINHEIFKVFIWLTLVYYVSVDILWLHLCHVLWWVSFTSTHFPGPDTSTTYWKKNVLNEFSCVSINCLCCVLYFICIRVGDCEKVANVMHCQLIVCHQNHILSPCDRYAKWLISAPPSM